MGSTGREAEVARADFPDGFVFGVATSAYQIEGARREGGKGDNIWDVFTEDKERVLDRSNGDIAVDHYHRYREDIELMASLGFRAYRFSISWARIFPDGLGGKVNEQGVAFYNNLINFQIAAQRRIDFQLGWYLDPIYFGDYPESMRERVGNDLPTFSEKDKEFIRNKIDFVGLNHYTSRLIAHHQNPGDIYFYQVQQVERIEKWNTGQKIGERAASEWLFIVPWGLHKLLNYIAKKYDNPPIYITENGMDEEDDQSATLEQALNDTTRVGYFKGYLASVAQAIKDGVDVRGYFAWSFLDNFEWAMGYTKRFGIVYVDYKNGLARHPKASALWFSHFLKGEAAENKADTN
ncbi:hypothetical protein PVAP13_5NG012329 [Panicum virgatum]|uniref:Uncharacterized protein n=1 Tax=Panicum virgatum TaxID=38727 RepID=A0A8T0S8V5_PANVG|nr:hypothetical protein PVAP13_5NG012329 [Panicum virgatum]